MKPITTVFCCICLMITGAFLALHRSDTRKYNQIHAEQPAQFMWNVPKGNVLPLDLQLDLEQRQTSNVTPKDSINIIDSVRYVDKVRWKIRYKNEDANDRTSARVIGKHLDAVNPDSLAKYPINECTPEREEQPGEVVGVPKTPSVQLTIDGNVVYSTDDNHSTGEGQ